MDARILLQKVYERDRDALFSHLHPDYVCHTPGASPIAGHFRGAAGMLEHIRQMADRSGGTFRPRHLGTFLTDGEWAMVPVHLVGERNGRTLDQPAFGIWRLQGGLLAEHWENPTDLEAFDAFWT